MQAIIQCYTTLTQVYVTNQIRLDMYRALQYLANVQLNSGRLCVNCMLATYDVPVTYLIDVRHHEGW